MAVYVRPVRIERFVDHYDQIAALFDRSPDELRARDEQQASERWLALRDDRLVGAAAAVHRPDDRTILAFVGDPETIGPLTTAASTEIRGRICAQVDGADSARVGALRRAGFAVEVVVEAVTIRFDSALRVFGRVPVPAGFSIVAADRVDAGRLFTLDNTIRQDVPGCDGWRGDRSWFRDELAEAPPFDPDGYLVAVDDTNGEYAGLVRIWRDPTGPRLGLIGVARQYRTTLLAAALLRRALEGAARWGSETFTTEASPSNATIHRRFERVGAIRDGRRLQMTLR